MMEPSLRFRLSRERDHDAQRRAGADLAAAVARAGGVLFGGGDELFAILRPGLPSLDLRPSGTSALDVTTTSWPGGPGFHEAVIAIVEEAARAADVELAIDDATGFAAARDRAALDAKHRELLRDKAAAALAFVDRVGDRAHVQLGLPLPGRLEHVRLEGDPPGIYTFAGKHERSFLESVARGAVDAASLLPWWNRSPTPDEERRLARAAVETQLTWCPARTELQRKLRRAVAAALRGARCADTTLIDLIERADRGEAIDGAPGLRTRPHVAALALGWRAVLPGHFETTPPDDTTRAPAGVTAGPLHLDISTRLETMGQRAPEGPFEDRAAALLFSPPAERATHRRDDSDCEHPCVGYAVERVLDDGGFTLVGQLVGVDSHLVVRVVVATGGDRAIAARIFGSIRPLAADAPSPSFLAL